MASSHYSNTVTKDMSTLMTHYVLLIKHDSPVTDLYQCLIVRSQYSQQDYSGIRRRRKSYTALTLRGLPGVHKCSWIARAHFWIEFELPAAVTMKMALFLPVSCRCFRGTVCLFRALFVTYRNNVWDNSILCCFSWIFSVPPKCLLQF